MSIPLFCCSSWMVWLWVLSVVVALVVLAVGSVLFPPRRKKKMEADGNEKGKEEEEKQFPERAGGLLGWLASNLGGTFSKSPEALGNDQVLGGRKVEKRGSYNTTTITIRTMMMMMMIGTIIMIMIRRMKRRTIITPTNSLLPSRYPPN